MSEAIVKIQNKGLVTIPKSFRDDLGLEESGLARIRKEKGRLVIEPVRIYPYSVRSYKDKEIEKFIKLDKKEAKILKEKGLL
ncbi:hypothetical protein A2962_03670 [Candidatus Woesebacteria bacterium RIFCSPLOWO2_01_FULL_39_61]|uniref:SpoVT-AbrB domain-containing protein n=1 Tax=Candidatus Woesebacteria bacterium RIFCSPHIGHO2_02_FULL_39_13 TaxID=1802505 RepID=A0A1F7Z2X6_9BACT|nr:MAG: hypothetical protein A2692_03850 [Candidatus Woesebacteria bacterium RIFCSPHIGHO2_01_FULL_39_95]OGM33790.1 MAG: hypothetical protein A3D01_02360 [Candidatus Woesebacteria bacterium RIFCSPHIGHO2_02_FULL_39_13]OGM38951.1 MAG: hypothetical protein A3E13_04630 [Candidatus Woesebacteria bacterium RIFCSPHIGHO2_12_FULL_40_20]OGM65599.1 MAG: hypothetical protein A2962_03670 [Candidatus Woesebacteria bacterium RIFCSPLOWO2_01_FULL_39_61]OGM72533.1 MAG: hypothetical protein A3H19_01150 [Candidatus